MLLHCIFRPLLFLMRIQQTSWIIHLPFCVMRAFLVGREVPLAAFKIFLSILAFIILVMAVSKRIFLCVTLSWDLLNFLQVYAFCHVESFVGCHSCLQIFFISFAFSLLIGIQLHTCYTSCPSSAWGSVHFLKYIFLCKYWQISMYISKFHVAYSLQIAISPFSEVFLISDIIIFKSKMCKYIFYIVSISLLSLSFHSLEVHSP